MQEIYTELGYPTVIASIPIFVRIQIESFMGCHISNWLGYFPGRRNGGE